MAPRPEPITPTTQAEFNFPDCSMEPSISSEQHDRLTEQLRPETLRNRRSSAQSPKFLKSRRTSLTAKNTSIPFPGLTPRSQSDAFEFESVKEGVSVDSQKEVQNDVTIPPITQRKAEVCPGAALDAENQSRKSTKTDDFQLPSEASHFTSQHKFTSKKTSMIPEISFMHDDSTILDEVREKRSVASRDDKQSLVPPEDDNVPLQRKIASAVLHPPGQHNSYFRAASDYHPAQIFRTGLNPLLKDSGDGCVYPWMSVRNNSTDEDDDDDDLPQSRLFPSMRFLIAVLLCCCYITMSISTSNMAVALICMIKCPLRNYSGDLDWESDQEGLVLAAQNAGSLLMLLTGLYADRINGKWMVLASLILCGIGNLTLPLFAHDSFWYAVIARIAIGASDACMSPAVNSLITRWFPRTERAAAIGIITGGRQIGTLFILPTAGYLCTRTDIQGGWPAIFYLSSFITVIVLACWLPMGADKPAKQYCISHRERMFIEGSIACESIGKRSQARRIPWYHISRSVPLWVGVFTLICHEYPLVIMLQFLPNYMRDVLEFAPTQNGLLSALPIFFLFLSKTLSASLSSWLAVNTKYSRTTICKAFNAIASAGLALSIVCVPQFGKDTAFFAVISLCFAMMFAGLHTPGVQTALLQLAPPFSGVITGISFFAVAWFSIGNKILTKWIVQNGTQSEWAMVFYISAIIAALPVVVFSLWGSDERQWWAMPSSKVSAATVATLGCQSTTSTHLTSLSRSQSQKGLNSV
ncbi:unnamed protein product [Bursaphelenchus okinawaensis]|uniref:Major facilitator superfamily (MFS) profile domain-containing protein n=1 Tax=Bursaphelenchus okinawaensis TaxID=465554 RepID=A0A811KYC9_9BILA|nr:unnamed protein product [Bursaphelenchus okinawaensis]CAG9113013.1 unnamed protein product [Bursaphelenchus okinawaensis]